MEDSEKKEWKEFFDFVETAVGDSPHSGDDETMDWFQQMMTKLRERTLE